MTATPTQLSVRYLREHGQDWPLVEVVEHYDHFQRRSHDLFGMFDILAIDIDGGVLAVQTTSYSNVPARVRKIADHPNLSACRKAGWTLHVHGWKKVKGRWTLARVVDVS